MAHTQPITPEDIVNHWMLRNAVIAPDGCHVAYMRRRNSKRGTPELPSEVWVADVETGNSQRITMPGENTCGGQITYLSLFLP
ncbi:MAG: hypothetical protein ACYDBJ_21745 [Aggregatilineales bacterium]